MTAPLDPHDYSSDGPTEFSWGPGLFPPGVAQNEGQRKHQGNFGQYAYPPMNAPDKVDNYARAVADRRTDPTDPESGRDFETLGNPDRYGPNPPLVQADPQPVKRQRKNQPVGLPPLKRKR